jgi:hypothetical protein
MTGILLRWLNHPAPMRSLARKAVKAFSLFSYEDRLRFCAIDRPHYGHCLFEAAKLAARLNYPRISAIEFGCGGGNGLLCAEMHVSEIEKVCPVKFDLYGFDSGEGLPAANDYRDFPYSTRKIAVNRAMPMIYPDQLWANQIYIYHDFKHPRYNDFVASDEQRSFEARIRLR